MLLDFVVLVSGDDVIIFLVQEMSEELKEKVKKFLRVEGADLEVFRIMT